MKLILGAGKTSRIKGFKNVDIQKFQGIDYVCDISILPFKNNSVSEIYASHCLEHFPHPQTSRVLAEWFRVLKPRGTLYVAVPDFDAGVRLYVKQNALTDFILSLLYGGQENECCIHYTSFNYKNLLYKLSLAGFVNTEKVDSFPFKLQDCSNLQNTKSGEKFSLNVITHKGGN